MRQAFAGLLWGKQFYHYEVRDGWREIPRVRHHRRSAAGSESRLGASV